MTAFHGSHLDLCRDLAAHLSAQGYRAWVEVRRVGVLSYGDAGRIDVLALTPWAGRTKFEMLAFEIKTQRSDLLRDVQTGKWRRYVAEYGVPRVSFAILEGIGGVEDVPSDAGLFIRREDGWKRVRGAKPLEGDQRKIDPLLLLALLSEPPYDANALRRREREARIPVPPSVAQAIKDASNVEIQDLIRYSRLSAVIGRDISRRIATPPKDVDSIHKWARGIIEIVAEATGRDAGEIQDQAARSGEYEELKRHIREGLHFRRERELMHRLLNVALAIGSTYAFDSNKLETAVRLLAEIEAAESAIFEDRKRSRRRSA